MANVVKSAVRASSEPIQNKFGTIRSSYDSARLPNRPV